MVLGSLMLFRTPALQVSLSLVIPITLGVALFVILATTLALKAQITKASTGRKGLVGEVGEVFKTLNPEGKVKVHGEIWRARCGEKLKKGTKIKVVAVEGMLLQVEPAE